MKSAILSPTSISFLFPSLTLFPPFSLFFPPAFPLSFLPLFYIKINAYSSLVMPGDEAIMLTQPYSACYPSKIRYDLQ